MRIIKWNILQKTTNIARNLMLKLNMVEKINLPARKFTAKVKH